MKQFIAFVIKETKHILRDKRTMLILFGMPVVMMLLFGFAITTDVKNVRTVVVTSEMSPRTQQAVERLAQSEYFVITQTVNTPREAEQLIRSQKADMSLTPSPSPKGEGSEYTQVSDTVKSVTTPLSTGRGAGGEASYVFNNVALDSILTTIAVAHGAQVEFENDAARQLRFHFVWKREDSLASVVEKLNTFEAVNIGMEDKKLVVR